MLKPRTFILCLGVTLAGFTTAGCYSAARPAFAQAAQQVPVVQNSTPEKFLESIYANYRTGGTGTSLQKPENIKLIDPALYTLIRRDLEQSKGEIPLLNYDPICNCQDFAISDIKVVSKVTNGQTLGVVTYSNMGKPASTGFDLVKTSGNWLINDISTADTPSLKKFLATNLAAPAR